MLIVKDDSESTESHPYHQGKLPKVIWDKANRRMWFISGFINYFR